MSKNKYFSGFILGLLLLISSVVMRANADNSVELGFLPSTTTIEINTSTEVEVYLKNGYEFNGYDITIAYDAEVLKLESWSHGDYFSNLVVIKQVNDPGHFRLAAAQLNSAAVSGDGILLSIVFTGLKPGESSVKFAEAAFATSSSELVIPKTQAGQVLVVEKFTPTPTLTRTFTSTPTMIVTPTQTRTLTHSSTPTISSSSWVTATDGVVVDTESTGEIEGSISGTPGLRLTSEAGQSTLAKSEEKNLATIFRDWFSDNNSQSDELTETPTGADGGTGIVESNNSRQEALNSLLWVLVIFLLVVLAAMVYLIVLRKKEKA